MSLQLIPGGDPDPTVWLRLADYLAGRGTDSERAALAEWIQAEPSRQKLLAQVEQLWAASDAVAGEQGPVDVDQGWRELSLRLPAAAHERPVALSRREVPLSAPFWTRTLPVVLSVAAAAVVLVAGGMWYLRGDSPTQGTRATPGASREVATTIGQRAEVRLDDGSRVILGVRSTLRWGQDFGTQGRDVYLTGEALFTVTHDSQRPFRVHSGDAVAEDLGTVFSVHGYPEDRRVVVVVKSGEVSMQRRGAAAGSPARLRPGDLGALAASGLPAVRHGVKVDDYQGFALGRLVFANTPLPEALARLQRWYDVRIVLADTALARASVTASFDNDSLTDVLETLMATLDARYVKRERMVEIRAR